MPIPAGQPTYTATPPPWLPDLPGVADYIPARTVVAAAAGYGNPLNTFDETTHPTGDQVLRLIVEAGAWVALRAGTVDTTLYPAAASVAAMRTAAMVELAYPDRDRDLTVATTLLTQADRAREDLARANEAATGEDVTDPGENVGFAWSFPPPAPYGDDLL